jgi:ABC-2 type transport system ATP-binding protein
MSAAIDVQRLAKSFGDVSAVDGVSFAVERGEIFGLLGPNGAGKSTLVRMLTTLIPPSGGSARIAGYDTVQEDDAVRRAIGVVPQASTSDPELTVGENVAFSAGLYRVPRRERRARVTAALEAVALTEWRDRRVGALSGGMRRRVEIARGLVHRPSVIFLDEPTANLDPTSRAALWDALKRLREERELTIFLSTHYMDEADRLCDRVAIMDRGQFMALDSPVNLKASIDRTDVVDCSFSSTPTDWMQTLERLPAVTSAEATAHAFRLTSSNGPETIVALLGTTDRAGIGVRGLSVQSTTLDAVFMHFTGRSLDPDAGSGDADSARL